MSTPTVETKSYRTETKVLDEGLGLVEAYVNSMGLVDSDGDIITPTAFDASIANNLPIPVLNHHIQSEVIGKVISARPIDFGNGEFRLLATMQMNTETQAGRDAFSNVKGQFVREWSVGFQGKKDAAHMEQSEGTTVRVIEDLDWVEASAVVRGASPNTQTVSAKEEKPEPIETVEEETASDAEKSAADTVRAEARQLEASILLDEIAAFKKLLEE